MADSSKVNWYGEDLKLILKNVKREGLAAVAFQVEGKTKLNIVANDQVDTGFMVNSVYTVTQAGGSTYQNKSGQMTDKNGRLVQRQMAPEAALPGGLEALVCVGADYAIFQEMRQPFLYKALADVAAEVGGILQTTAKGKGL